MLSMNISTFFLMLFALRLSSNALIGLFWELEQKLYNYKNFMCIFLLYRMELSILRYFSLAFVRSFFIPFFYSVVCLFGSIPLDMENKLFK